MLQNIVFQNNEYLILYNNKAYCFLTDYNIPVFYKNHTQARTDIYGRYSCLISRQYRR